MKYTKEEYIEIAEKAETVNRAFRNNPDYNNINIEQDLSRIKTPTVVIQGDQDYVVGLEHADLIYNGLSGLSEENKEIHIIPNTGHSPAIESPEKLSEILTTFYSKHNN
ncbi:MAG TPA: alpha/beta hydrolase [Salegentibacter sp.]|nr:alpha/beta hydrolase [Salegentibacter sp.]